MTVFCYWKAWGREPGTKYKYFAKLKVQVSRLKYSDSLVPHFYLPSATSTSVRPSVYSTRFCINLNISFIYEDIFTKFAGNVYGYEKLSLRKI